MPGDDAAPLIAVIACPNCGEEGECQWQVPEEGDEDVEPCLQLCNCCGTTWTEPWPGYSFRTEAG